MATDKGLVDKCKQSKDAIMLPSNAPATSSAPGGDSVGWSAIWEARVHSADQHATHGIGIETAKRGYHAASPQHAEF